MTSGVPTPRPSRAPAWADQRLLHRVGEHVAGGLAGVHVEAGDAPRMVVVEHQPRALLVGVEERLRPGARIGHVGDVADADALRDTRVLSSGGGDPLVRRAVADPRGDAAVQVQGGAVLGEAARPASGSHRTRGSAPRPVTVPSIRRHVHGHAVRVERHHVRARARAHERGVDRQEQVPALARRQQVAEQDAHRPVLRGDDGRPEVVGVVDAGVARRSGCRHAPGRGSRCVSGTLAPGHDARRELHVAAQQRGRQVWELNFWRYWTTAIS